MAAGVHRRHAGHRQHSCLCDVATGGNVQVAADSRTAQPQGITVSERDVPAGQSDPASEIVGSIVQGDVVGPGVHRRHAAHRQRPALGDGAAGCNVQVILNSDIAAADKVAGPRIDVALGRRQKRRDVQGAAAAGGDFAGSDVKAGQALIGCSGVFRRAPLPVPVGQHCRVIGDGIAVQQHIVEAVGAGRSTADTASVRRNRNGLAGSGFSGQGPGHHLRRRGIAPFEIGIGNSSAIRIDTRPDCTAIRIAEVSIVIQLTHQSRCAEACHAGHIRYSAKAFPAFCNPARLGIPVT